MEHEELLSVIEAILFAAGDPVPASRIALVTGEETQTIVSAARELAAAYEENRCGMRLVQMNDLLMTGKSDAEEKLRYAEAELSRLNVEYSERGKEIMSLKMISNQNEHLRKENQRLLLELSVYKQPLA